MKMIFLLRTVLKPLFCMNAASLYLATGLAEI